MVWVYWVLQIKVCRLLKQRCREIACKDNMCAASRRGITLMYGKYFCSRIGLLEFSKKNKFWKKWAAPTSKFWMPSHIFGHTTTAYQQYLPSIIYNAYFQPRFQFDPYIIFPKWSYSAQMGKQIRACETLSPYLDWIITFLPRIN